MEWKDLTSTVGKLTPLVGTLIGGPAAPMIGAMLSSALGTGNTPYEVSQALATNPEAAVKIKQIESDNRIELQKLIVQSEANRLAADTATIVAVNATMQAEAKSDHWPSYTWRPFIGFITGIMLIGVYFILPLTKTPIPAVPESVWLMLGGILGVASWFRGKMQADPGVPTDNRG